MKLSNPKLSVILILQILLFTNAMYAVEPDRAEQVNIFVNKIIGPVTYAGSGWLSGTFSNELPDDTLLLPLKTQRVRDRDCHINILQGLLTKTDRKPLHSWRGGGQVPYQYDC